MVKKEQDSGEYVVVRARKILRDRLAKLADRKNTTITALTQSAIEKFLEREEYTLSDLLKIVQNSPSLMVSVDKIKEEMKECPPLICGQIIGFIKDKQVYLYEENLDTLIDRLQKIDKKNLFGIYLHIVSKNGETNKVNEALKKISEIMKGQNIQFGAGLKENDHEKVLIFVSYKRGEESK